MNTPRIKFSRSLSILLAGDVVTLALVTLVGFSTHGTLTSAGLRIWTTFIPMLLAWLAAAPLLRLFDLKTAARPLELWRVLWAMLFVAPLGSVLRSMWLQSVVQPTFVLVMAAFCGLGLLLWRITWLGLQNRFSLKPD